MYDLDINFLDDRSGDSRRNQTEGGMFKKLRYPLPFSQPQNRCSNRGENIPVQSDPQSHEARDYLDVDLNNFSKVIPTPSLAKTRFNFQEISQTGHNQTPSTSSVSLPEDCTDPREVSETRKRFEPGTEYLLFDKDTFHAAVRESIANKDHRGTTKLASITTKIEIPGYGDLEVSIEFPESMNPNDYERVKAFGDRSLSPGETCYSSFIYKAIYEAGITVQATERLQEDLSDSAKDAAQEKLTSGELGPLELNDSHNVIVMSQAQDFTIKYFQISASSGMTPLKVVVDATAKTKIYVAVRQSSNPTMTRNHYANTHGQLNSTNLLGQAQNVARDTVRKINPYYVVPLIGATAISASFASLLPLGLANFSNIAILGSGVISLACSISSNRLGKIIKDYENIISYAEEDFLANYKTRKRLLDIVGSSYAGLSLGLGGALVAASSSFNGLPYLDILGTMGMFVSAARPVTVGFKAGLSGLNKVKGDLTTGTNEWIQNAGELTRIALSKAKPNFDKFVKFFRSLSENRK